MDSVKHMVLQGQECTADRQERTILNESLDGTGSKFKCDDAFSSKYWGHKGREETFYYYHQVDKTFRIIRQKDSKSASVIPKVHADE